MNGENYTKELERKFGLNSNMDSTCRECGLSYGVHFGIRCPRCPLCNKYSPSDEPCQECTDREAMMANLP